MRRYLATALAVCMIATPARAAVLQDHHHKAAHAKPCQYDTGTTYGRKHLILCLADLRGAPGGPRYVLGLASRESGYDYADWDTSDGYADPFQQAVRYWRGRLYEFERWAGIPVHYVSPADPRMGTAVSIHMAKQDGTWCLDWRGTC